MNYLKLERNNPSPISDAGDDDDKKPSKSFLSMEFLSVNGIFASHSEASSRCTSISVIQDDDDGTDSSLSDNCFVEENFERDKECDIVICVNADDSDKVTSKSYELINTQCPDQEINPIDEHPRKLYPTCDSSVWLRSCEQEIIEPIKGDVKGCIPEWINGTLLRNGPGNLKVGEMRFNHLFDSSALLHRFAIKEGQVTYQTRFLLTDTYKKNMAAQRIVVTEFGTSSIPDPCQSIFQKVSAVFKPGESSDNAMISIYPFGDEYFAFTETPIIHKVNIENLATERKINLFEHVGIVNHTSHPHVMRDGTVYNMGMTVTKKGPSYNIIKFPHGEQMFENAQIVASVPARWKLNPGYMHTFGITENYFVIVEQPLSVSVASLMKQQMLNQPLINSLKWFADKQTHIYLINKFTGELSYTFKAERFFYLHIINQYEKDHHLVLDICCYRNPDMLDCMYVESIENMQQNPDYANMFRGKPLRFVLPLSAPKLKKAVTRSFSIENIFSKVAPKFTLKRSESEYQDITYNSVKDAENNATSTTTGNNNNNLEMETTNIVTLVDTEAKAYQLGDGSIFCRPELLCDLGCETPRINYEENLGMEYRYFYAISSDVDAVNPGTIIKVDVMNKTKLTWCEDNCYPSEPIFVASPKARSEDDGVILTALVWGNGDENRTGLLVLCAKTFTELGRCEFRTPGPVPKCLHGWYVKTETSGGEEF